MAVLCFIPTAHLCITVHTGTLQGLPRGFLFAAHMLDLDFPGGKCAPPSPAAKRGHRPGLMPGMETSAQPEGNHPHRTQPAASHPASGSLSISIHRAQPLKPLCASHRPRTPNEGTRTPAMGLWPPLSTPSSAQGSKHQSDVNSVTSVRTN